jgi:hypothetical protein
MHTHGIAAMQNIYMHVSVEARNDEIMAHQKLTMTVAFSDRKGNL